MEIIIKVESLGVHFHQTKNLVLQQPFTVRNTMIVWQQHHSVAEGRISSVKKGKW